MNSNRLKDIIKTRNSGISVEEYRIRYATERFLSRLQESDYKDNFILKGGFLLGAIFKVEQRTTRDLDTLLKEISADKMNVTRVLENIVSIDLDDGVRFELINLSESQQQRKYDGFRAKFKMTFLEENSIVQFDLDLGVGDTITPKAEVIDIPLLFNEKKGDHKSITLQAYPIETILAEKTEIILDLGTKNSRMKDFYDIHLILNYQYKPSITKCYKAFENTWLFRHKELPIDAERFEDWFFIVDEIIANKKMNDIYWKNYIKDREYAKHLRFKTILRQFKEYLEKLHRIYIE
ncbi:MULTISPECIES: nucleotidyl transferase AbiEii/AbiGii toxin family protein [unclassified Enterococcus]|uniref:nucleotidyl transferase AbiEii/AbiGii toxin family protein n=1 Tax=unclassified Enterococcus TaxID=2608891 RepID=UPI001A9244AE|nr:MULTISPECIES: nucleotidyl transferase AbiEii/AbiGii toxin family protein [unclassified Enterococcus]MBO0461155.1 nucleotidyl transferase AbiEii/AbiGii toxin family protein [Enterococcus sp. DIV1298c]MBO1299865.1 nucleotidyl transferase AbiEii/AbiGii toxin family protein [Enterococcus sp. DIV1271a]